MGTKAKVQGSLTTLRNSTKNIKSMCRGACQTKTRLVFWQIDQEYQSDAYDKVLNL